MLPVFFEKQVVEPGLLGSGVSRSHATAEVLILKGEGDVSARLVSDEPGKSAPEST